ncbi:TatD family hydrolase [uncultured Muribaculum sp.]|uniref:TatD family hydrolase n=1 Tax=uncultured Muribaculum sp. TaxID=1918613 RepID=UPI0025B778ED|nr:TatD family hydrolase [uncultured Muribaculum sp.]
MIVDTHTHLYLSEFEHPDDAVTRALEAGVEHMLFPNVDVGTIEPMKSLHARFPRVTSMAVGLHPTEVNENWREALDLVERELDSGTRYVAVGEVGMDLYWDKTFRAEQREVFARQVDWAASRDLPVIIHCRDGLDDTLDVLASAKQLPKAVFHSFGGTAEDVERIREIGDFYFGINGIVTFKNSKLRDVLPVIGLDRTVLETDAPYLAPVPHRGKRNESAFIIHTAAHVASALQLSIEEVSDVTSNNAKTIFNLDI